MAARVPAAAPLEERPPAVREPAAPPRPPRPPRRAEERAPSRAGASGAAVAGGFAAAASTAGARAATWSRVAAVRTRDGIVAAYTSPRTRRARATAAEYTRRAASGAADAARRGSVYAREQYAIDPRRTLIVGGIAAAAVLLLLVLLVSARGGGGRDATTTEDSPAQQPALGTPLPTGTNGAAAPAASPTPAAATAQPLPGNPYSETAILASMQSRGLVATPSTDAFACDNPGTTPKSYRVTSNGAEQRVVLLVYPDAAAFSRDWAATGGRPQYRNGNCAAGAALVYFNVNVMMVFPQTTNAGVQSQISDAFLALP